MDGLEVRGDDTLVWFRSDGYTVEASIAARGGKPLSSTYIRPLMEGLKLSLNEMIDGEYTVNWYDPQMARWLDISTVTAENNVLNIPIPPIRYNLAAKIIQKP